MPVTPAMPAWHAVFQNMERELVDEEARVEGALPDELRGLALLRNGPGVFERFGVRLPHWFDAQGVVTRMRFGAGAPRATARVVRHPGFEREERAGRYLYGRYAQRSTRPFREAFLRDRNDASNIGVLQHRGAIYSIADSGPPIELDVRTLATKAPTTFGDTITNSFAAHRRRAPSRRADYSFGIAYGRHRLVELFEIPDDGPVRLLARVPVPDVGLVHDFGVTERHAVVPLAPYRLRMLPLLFARRAPVDCFEWRPERPTVLMVFPLDAPDRMFRVEVPAFVLEHTLSMREEGGEIVWDFTRYASPEGREQYVDGLAAGRVRGPLAGRVERLRIDVAARTARAETVIDRCVELAQAAPGSLVAWGPSFREPGSRELFDALVEVDLARGELTPLALEPGQHPTEPLLLPMRDAEGPRDTWVVSIVFEVGSGACYEAVFDGRRPGAPPVCKVHYPTRVPPRTHGIVAPDLLSA